MATDVARLALQIDVTGAQRAKQALAGLQDGSIKATRASNQLAASTTRLSNVTRGAGGNFRFMRGSIQQVGFQVGDFATQVSSGQSAIVAFGQQASQLAGIMGPGGALLGAVIAIGAGIAGAFSRSMMTGAESTETLTERIGDLRDNIDELTEAQIRGLRVEFFAANRERAAAIQSERENIRSLTQELTNLKEAERAAEEQALMSGGMTPQLAELQKEIRSTSNELELAKGSLQTYYSEADNAAVELKELIEGNQDAAKEAEKTAEKIRDLVTAAEQEAATIGMSSRAIATYEAALAGANAEQILAIDRAYQRIEAHKSEVEMQKRLQEQYKVTAANDPLLNQVSAQGRGQDVIASIRERAEAVRTGLDQEFAIRQAHKDRVIALNDALRLGVINSEKERARLEVLSLKQRNEAIRQLEQQKFQIFTQGQEAMLSATGRLFGTLAQIAQKGGEESFQAYQNLASAEAAVATALAVSKALAAAPPPLNFALAGAVGALGAVQIAAIQSQEYQGSYLGGGYTGNGPRSGGVDGAGGFPAILHPNETVIDHSMGQGLGGNTYIEIIDQSSGNKTYERQSMTDENGMRKTRILIRDMMREDIQKGEFDRQMENAYGVRRKARRV